MSNNILVLFDFHMPGEDATAQYEAVMTELESRPEGFPGLVSHIACPKGDRLFIADIWESPQAFEDWMKVLEPITAKHGLTQRPEVHIHHGHRTFIPTAV